MWVKICANTNLEDALLAAERGADAVGFVFAPSPRRVTPRQVGEISERLPMGIERIGVFANRDVEGIAAAVAEAALTTVQLHGGVDGELVGRLRERLGSDVSVIQSVHWIVGEDEESTRGVRAQLRMLSAGDRVLIDAKVGGFSGGLGVRFDWKWSAAVLAEFPALRVIIAGGLTPKNVSEAVRVFAPYGVDVASGVERSPGHKDAEKVRSFIENARRA